MRGNVMFKVWYKDIYGDYQKYTVYHVKHNEIGAFDDIESHVSIEFLIYYSSRWKYIDADECSPVED
jgi:hypothetical protein